MGLQYKHVFPIYQELARRHGLRIHYCGGDSREILTLYDAATNDVVERFNEPTGDNEMEARALACILRYSRTST